MKRKMKMKKKLRNMHEKIKNLIFKSIDSITSINFLRINSFLADLLFIQKMK